MWPLAGGRRGVMGVCGGWGGDDVVVKENRCMVKWVTSQTVIVTGAWAVGSKGSILTAFAIRNVAFIV